MTPALFAVEVEGDLGINPTPQNVDDLTAWEKQEGGNWANDAKYNPLNTTEPEPGAGNTGSQGNIKVYTSWKEGVAATVATLKGYPGIQSALRSNDTPSAFSAAVASSPWGTGAIGATGETLTTKQLQALQKGAAVDVITGGSSSPFASPGSPLATVAGAAGGAVGGAVTSAVDAVFGGFFSMVKSDAEKATLIAVLVGGGAALTAYGLVRLLDVHPNAFGSPAAGDEMGGGELEDLAEVAL